MTVTIDTLRNIVKNGFEILFEDELPVQEWPCGHDDPEYVDEYRHRCFVCGEGKDAVPGLLVDVMTAQAMVLVYDAFERDANREKFERMITTPVGFVKCAEFSWNKTKIGSAS